ncbi:hypothetical protein Tco_1313836 [Tanacetum coccineum]
MDIYKNIFNSKLSMEESNEMIKEESDEEVKEALFDIKDDKALGPNGFTSKFFKEAWDTVGKDVCQAVQRCFKTGKLLGETKGSGRFGIKGLINAEKLKGINLWDVQADSNSPIWRTILGMRNRVNK